MSRADNNFYNDPHSQYSTARQVRNIYDTPDSTVNSVPTHENVSPATKISVQKAPKKPDKFFVDLGLHNLYNWDNPCVREWFRQGVRNGITKVRESGFNTRYSWKDHKTGEQERAQDIFQAQLKEEFRFVHIEILIKYF